MNMCNALKLSFRSPIMSRIPVSEECPIFLLISRHCNSPISIIYQKLLYLKNSQEVVPSCRLCAVFWRKDSRRCIGFDWRMSQTDCESLEQEGKLPNKTKKCGYSNGGLSCRFALVKLDATDDSDKAWPNHCFKQPTVDNRALV